ncbi:MAG: hypothetical protein QOH18_1212, partial [Solirubrobacterales bacterium]|nr:hypothetical protein [Solirubrobacterales bacterium]
MVDAERVGVRLRRLEELLERLTAVREEGETSYLSHPDVRAATERRLEVAVQICIDLGAQLVTEQSVKAPDSYAAVFTAMAEAGLLSAELAQRMGAAARQRNLLTHLYLEIDDRMVFASLG